MSWPSYDRTTWGLIISVSALVFAFPLSLLANLATPAIRSWWATRSISSFKNQIEQLEKKLAEVEATPLYSHFEWCVMRGIARVGWLVLSIGDMIIWLLMLFAAAYTWVTGSRIPGPILALVAIFIFANVFTQAKARMLFHQAVIEGTEKGRAEMRESIAKLKGELAKKEPAPRAFQ